MPTKYAKQNSEINKNKDSFSRTSAAINMRIYSTSEYDEKYSRTDGCIAINAVFVTIATELRISKA